ncbi:MAG: Uma2 family endonuclease [Acidimicrobiales bacterium]
MAVELRRRAWTVEEYHRMAETGLLSEDDRVELLGGEIVEMSPIGARHARCVDRLNALLVPPSHRRAIVRVQGPVRLSETSEPQPDIALLRWREDFYPELPRPADVLLLIEVADTSLATDRAVKLPLYADARVPEVWLVNLAARAVERHAGPSRGGYSESSILAPGESIAVPSPGGFTLAVSDIVL